MISYLVVLIVNEELGKLCAVRVSARTEEHRRCDVKASDMLSEGERSERSERHEAGYCC